MQKWPEKSANNNLTKNNQIAYLKIDRAQTLHK